MLDDVVAGIYAGATLYGARTFSTLIMSWL
jgi:hypothetical protein